MVFKGKNLCKQTNLTTKDKIYGKLIEKIIEKNVTKN